MLQMQVRQIETLDEPRANSLQGSDLSGTLNAFYQNFYSNIRADYYECSDNREWCGVLVSVVGS